MWLISRPLSLGFGVLAGPSGAFALDRTIIAHARSGFVSVPCRQRDRTGVCVSAQRMTSRPEA